MNRRKCSLVVVDLTMIHFIFSVFLSVRFGKIPSSFFMSNSFPFEKVSFLLFEFMIQIGKRQVAKGGSRHGIILNYIIV